VTQGIKVEAQAIIHHMFCHFDRSLFDETPKYFFVYQLRLSVVQPVLHP